MWLSSFLDILSLVAAPFTEVALFAPWNILAFFVKNKVPICAWIYFWHYLLIFFHWCIFLVLCQYHTVLMTVALQYNLKSGRLIPPAPFFFIKTTLDSQGLLCFHMNCEFFCSSSVKSAIGNLISLFGGFQNHCRWWLQQWN